MYVQVNLAIALWLIVAPSLFAVPYRVELAGKDQPTRTARLQAQRIDTDTTAPPLEFDVCVPCEGQLDIPEGTWELTLKSNDVWAAPVYVNGNEPAVFHAVPAGVLRTPVDTAERSNLPQITVLLTAASSDSDKMAVQRADVSCPVTDNVITCVVPAGLWDARITATGYVPQFRWSVQVKPNKIKTLGPVALIRGAAIIGTVLRADGAAPPQDVRVTLVPSEVAPQDARDVARRVTPTAKGQFVFEAVPPGDYYLTASGKSLTSDSRHIRVIADRTAELKEPLLVDSPKTLRATIFPSTDPEGRPWILALAVKRFGVDAYDSFGESPATPEGAWEQKNLRNGDYILSVMRAGGGEWNSVPFRVDGADVDLPVNVPAVTVEGLVRFGDRPLAARLHFGGESGPRRQLLESDSEGRFSGVIPAREKEEWDILIESDAPPMRRTLVNVRGRRSTEDSTLRFELEVPRTVVLGTVVLADGKPAENAIVTVQGRGREFDQVFPANDGTFQLTGLAPGIYRITAEAFLMSSEVTQYEVRPDDNLPLRLVLQDSQKVRGRVVTGAGLAIIGASIEALPRNTPVTGITAVRSNESGAFLLLLPRDVSLIDVLVIPPGFAAMMARLPVRTDQVMEVTVTQHGGVLVTDTPIEGTLTLTHNGALWPLVSLARRVSGSIADDKTRKRVTFPSMEPGQYTVCGGADCASGYLPPHGTLELKVK